MATLYKTQKQQEQRPNFHFFNDLSQSKVQKKTALLGAVT
jgi:hypothetical protein